MKEFKGTPGPWTGKDVGVAKQDDARLQLGFVMTIDEKRRDECGANAKLIAAAPELLEALQETIHEVGHWLSTQKPELKEKIESAINKALGE